VFISAFKGIGLPASLVYIVGVIEVFGGVMLLLGLYTRLAAVFLVIDMIDALWKYNFSEGIYAVGEYELPLMLGLAALTLATTGAGRFSLDHVIGRDDE
jgi:putative oxidoreductase